MVWMCSTAFLVGSAFADWPQYRGPNGDGISPEKMLSAWPSSGPKVLWKQKVGGGLGSFAIKNDHAFFLAADGDNESCHAIELKTGKPIWTMPIGPTQSRSSGQGGSGPGSTPVADGDKVYVYGSRLKLICFNAADGKTVWQHDIQREFGGQADSQRAISSWGNACSPIVEGDLVIIQGGGNGQLFIAFNKTTGAVAWKKETGAMTQSTPAVATIGGVRQVIFLVQSGLVSLDPKTGDALWKQPYQGATAIGASPVVSGDIVYCSIGYNVGGGAFQVTKNGDRFEVKQLWRTPGKNMQQWSTPVIHNGYVYSLDSAGGPRSAKLQCVELKTGNLVWAGPAVGQGETVLIDGKLIVQAASGKLLLVDPTPQGYKEISSAQPLDGQAWGWPAFSNGVFLYRTYTEAAALDLSAP
jgi:outer membrane protein assembly factor BamB